MYNIENTPMTQIEKMLCDKNRAFEGNAHKLYKYILSDIIAQKDVVSNNSKIGITQNGNGHILLRNVLLP